MSKRVPSGPSGRNTQPQRLLRASPELWAQIDQAVAQSGGNWSGWAREALATAAGAWIIGATHAAFGTEGEREYIGTELGAKRAAGKIAKAGGHGWRAQYRPA